MNCDLKAKSLCLDYSDEDLNKILESRGRKLSEIEEDVKVIKEWLKLQPHLPMHPTDRQIVCFLVMNKFSIEKSKEKIDNNYTIKTLVPDYYNVLPTSPEIEESFKTNTWVTLPKLTKNLNRVHVYRLEQPEDFNVTTMYAIIFHILELRTVMDFSDSDEYIYDMKNFTMGVITKFSLMDVKKVVTIIEKVYSFRLAALHLINLPPYAETLVAFAKSLLKAKIGDRVVVHKNFDSLLDYYTKDELPSDFGGSGKSLLEVKDDVKKLYKENEDYLMKVMKARVDESKRPTKLVNDDLLGFHGNFRKLQVD